MNLSAAKKILSNVNFTNWFGNSVVKDEVGNPIRVYHGTDKNFNEFAKTNDIGFHFGTADQASYKASGSEGGNIIPAYLRLENPINLPDHVWDTPDTLIRGLKHLDTQGTLAKKVNEWNQFTQEWKREHKRLENVVSRTASEDYNKAVGEWLPKLKEKSVDVDREAQRIIKNAGYDGVVYDNAVEGSGKSYIAFDPTQIKSVNNRGTFDQKDPNILKGSAAAIGAGAALAGNNAYASEWQNFKSDEEGLQDAYNPLDMAIAAATGGATLTLKAAAAALDPIIDTVSRKIFGE